MNKTFQSQQQEHKKKEEPLLSVHVEVMDTIGEGSALGLPRAGAEHHRIWSKDAKSLGDSSRWASALVMPGWQCDSSSSKQEGSQEGAEKNKKAGFI